MQWSTNNLEDLPRAERLQQIMQSLAALEAIVCPDWEYRYFSFNTFWSKGQKMGSMRNGSGDFLFTLFEDKDAVMKGFDHEVKKSLFSLKLLDDRALLLQQFFAEPAFSPQETTFCIVNQESEKQWAVVFPPTPNSEQSNGSEWMLNFYHGQAKTYQAWAEAYYEISLDLNAVDYVMRGEILNRDIISRLNPELSLEQLQEDLDEIGYPAT